MKDFLNALQALLREHNCTLYSSQHYSDDCWITAEKDNGETQWIYKIDGITAVFKETI